MKRLFAATAAALIVAAATPVLAQKQMPGGHSQGSGSDAMMQSMMGGMKDMQSMQMSGDTDKDFAQMMRMHYKHGVEMAETEVKDGKDPKMKQMARKIIDSQRKEIKEFDDWLAKKK